MKELQILCGYLNFLNKAIYPGRVFTRRMYAKYANVVDYRMSESSTDSQHHIEYWKLKQYHHVRLDREFKADCKVWLEFLNNENLHRVISRPMIDTMAFKSAEITNFTSDASAAKLLGFGCVLDNNWCYGAWGQTFIEEDKPSIEFLELYALCIGILTWQELLQNRRIIIFCDNTAVVQMVNNLTSSCQHSMYLLRILVLNGLLYNRRVYVRYIDTKSNYLSDSLSRMRIDKFKSLAPKSINQFPDIPSAELWPPQHIFRAANSTQ